MTVKIIDGTGKVCPIPVVEAQKALEREGFDGVLITVDNITAAQNLEKMAIHSGYRYGCRQKSDACFDVSILREISDEAPEWEDGRTKAPPRETPEPEVTQTGLVALEEPELPVFFESLDSSPGPAVKTAAGPGAPVKKKPKRAGSTGMQRSGSFGILVGRETLGEGSRELGEVLIKGFLYSLSETEKLPEFIIFLNGGAFLTARKSPVLSQLKALEQKGVEILTCGTCSNYYGLENALEAGSVVNMFEIAEKLTSVQSVLTL